MSTETNQALMQAISAVSSSHESVYGKAQGYSLDDWIEDQKFLAGCAGATAAIVPGLHFAGMAADLAFLLNRMNTCSFGVGTILGNEYFDGSILEEEDFYNVLALWSGDDDARRLIEQKTSYVVLSQLGVKGGTKLIGTACARAESLLMFGTCTRWGGSVWNSESCLWPIFEGTTTDTCEAAVERESLLSVASLDYLLMSDVE